MRKFVFALLTLGLFYTAQAQRPGGWQLGIEGGPGYYTMLNAMDKNARPEIIAFDNPQLLSSPRNWAAGAKAIYLFTEQIGLQTGLRYYWGRQDYTFGYGDKISGLVENGTISTELNYLQVPLMLHWQTENKSGLRFYLAAGVAPAWLFHYYENTSKNKNSGNVSSQVTITNTALKRTFYSHTVDFNGTIIERASEGTYENNDEYRLYKTMNVFFNAELGLLVPVNKGWCVNVGFNYYQSLINPDNIEGKRWELDKYTRNEIPKSSNPLEEPTKYDRPKTTLMSVGLTLGLVYDFNW